MTKDRILSAVVFIGAVILYIESFNIRTTGFQAFDSALYPRILLIAMGLTALIIFIKSFFIKKEKTVRREFNIKGRMKLFWDTHYKVIFLFILFGVYVYFLPSIGFIISTTIFLFVAQSMLYGFKKVNKIVLNFIVSITTSTIVFLIFNEGLRILLP